MVKLQALKLLPGVNVCAALSARRIVLCTRSSARWLFPVSERAKPRKSGRNSMAPAQTTACRSSGVTVADSGSGAAVSDRRAATDLGGACWLVDGFIAVFLFMAPDQMVLVCAGPRSRA